jgi:hypothetical protein
MIFCEGENKILNIHHRATEGTEKTIYVCREVPTNIKLLAPTGNLCPKARRFMENRHLPILHNDILLCELCVSNESCLRRTSGR